MRWFWKEIGFFFEVLHSPEIAFQREFPRPSYLVPLCVLGIMGICISVLQSPVQMEWMRLQLEAVGMPADQVRARLEMLSRSNVMAALLTPVLLFLRWLLLASMLWLTAAVFLDTLTYRKVLSIVAFSYLPILGRDAVSCMVLLLRGEDALRHGDGMTVALGLNLLFPSMPLPWSALAGSVSIFEVWFVTLLVVGISKATPARPSLALAIVMPTWLIAVVLQAALATLVHAINAQFGDPAGIAVR
jgi:hypothetical protein